MYSNTADARDERVFCGRLLDGESVVASYYDLPSIDRGNDVTAHCKGLGLSGTH